MDVSKNRGTPKWMVKIMENPIKMDDLGGPPLFLEAPTWRLDPDGFCVSFFVSDKSCMRLGGLKVKVVGFCYKSRNSFLGKL